MHTRVVRDYVAQYPDPITGISGQRLAVIRRDDEYPGWLWCQSADGKEGWVPEAFLNVHDAAGTLLRDFDAHELSVCTGEVVIVLESVSQWTRITNRAGLTGWIPTHCLTTG